MAKLKILFTLLGLLWPLIKIAFLLGFVLLIINKISSYSYKQVKKKILLMFITILTLGIPIFLFRNLIIFIFELDYDAFAEFLIVFVSVTFFKEFFLHAGGTYVKDFTTNANTFESPNIFMMNNPNSMTDNTNANNANKMSISNAIGETVIDPMVIGPEERNMNVHIENGQYVNHRQKVVTKEIWGYSKRVISSFRNGPLHIFTGGNVNFDFNDVDSHKTICVNFGHALRREASLRGTSSMSLSMFTLDQRQFLTKALIHYYPDDFRDLPTFNSNNRNHIGEQFRLTRISNNHDLQNKLISIATR